MVDTADNPDHVTSRGPKVAVHHKAAVASAQHPIVCETIIDVLKRGGSAADAAVAGALTDGVVENLLTTYGGLVTLLYFDAATRTTHQLLSTGAFPPDLPVFRPIPDIGLSITQLPPSACIPGFMPGLGALHARFGTLPWASLCEPAIGWAEDGFPMSPDLYLAHFGYLPFVGYFPEGRALFAPDGFVTKAGERFSNPKLAETLHGLARDGPGYFTEGAWAEEFIATANRLGWAIKLPHMTMALPRWEQPLSYRHRGYEVRQLAPPNAEGVLCRLALGILDHLGVSDLAPDAAERLFLVGHVLRWVNREIGYLNDPDFFTLPIDVWMDEGYHRRIARVIAATRPKVDLSDHVMLTAGPVALGAVGADQRIKTPVGSSELSVIDRAGNWCQIMTTLQSGGIPGQVVGGVAMFGSHATFGLPGSGFDQWLAPGMRMRSILGNTQIFRHHKPVLQFGSSGAVHANVLQVLSGVLDHGLSVEAAIGLPRMMPLGEDGTLSIEGRVAPEQVADLVARGIKVKFLGAWDSYMGSFHATWREPRGAGYGGCADPRYTGVAMGLD
ncbi:gamma-glutamyltransferase [Bradyrhizobium jicamae]|uniref:gamma-glutamyltransferase n=1 Tax=Bradyrhizobium jicamae TaxID=280332 RepID=UPI001BA52544|nr:gamma-glutamyltransferase [Bradyrhizobium jicamae]